MGRPRGLSFADRVVKTDTCWNWTGPVNDSGYGSINVMGRTVGVHVMAFVEACGAVPIGMEVRHSCDNRVCVNPAHLSTGTKKDNMQDAVTRGRTARGERNARARLSEADVRNIRVRHGDGQSISSIARAYGVAYITVWQIVRGTRWGWL